MHYQASLKKTVSDVATQTSAISAKTTNQLIKNKLILF